MYKSFEIKDVFSDEEPKSFATRAEICRCVANYLQTAADEMERGVFSNLDIEIFGKDEFNERLFLNEIII